MADERNADFLAERRRYLGLPQLPQTRAPFQSHSSTSIQAAQAIDGKLNELQARVLFHIRSHKDYGATDEEMQVSLGMNPSTQRPRRIELLAMGKIYDDGTRKTRSGRNATVWVAR